MPFFQLGLAASTLGFTTLAVTACGYLLSGNLYMPMPGTLGRTKSANPFIETRDFGMHALATGAVFQAVSAVRPCCV